MKKHTGDSYLEIGERYATEVDTRPWNAYYERPSVLSLLPDIDGKDILDAACGSGWYAEYFIGGGAKLTAFDLHLPFVEITKKRTKGKANVFQADLTAPLSFSRDGQHDIINCSLALHYLKDWRSTLDEFYRVLQHDGHLVFSTHHPFMDWDRFKKNNYFATEMVEDIWDIGKVSFYRRPLGAILESLDSSGFYVEKFLEARPVEKLRASDPETFRHLSNNPGFMIVRAKKK